MKTRTRGQLESEISNAFTRFEKEHLGRGPRDVRSYIVEDMILVRLKGVLTPAEEMLAGDEKGARLIREVRMKLIDSSRAMIEEMVEAITGAKIQSLYTDISAENSERVIVLGMDRRLFER